MNDIDLTFQNIKQIISFRNEYINLALDEIATTHFDTDTMQNVYRLKDDVLSGFSIFTGCSQLKEISKRMNVVVRVVIHL